MPPIVAAILGPIVETRGKEGAIKSIGELLESGESGVAIDKDGRGLYQAGRGMGFHQPAGRGRPPLGRSSRCRRPGTMK